MVAVFTQQKLYGLFELDADGKALYARAEGEADDPPRDFVGLNFSPR
jgi:hypothetical protein